MSTARDRRTRHDTPTTGLVFTVTDAGGTPLPEPTTVRAGADIVLVVTVTEPHAAVSYRADISRDGQVVVSNVAVNPTFSLELEDVTAEEHGGEWTATLSVAGTTVATAWLTLEVTDEPITMLDVDTGSDADTTPDADVDDDTRTPGVFDEEFAFWGVLIAVVAFIIIGGLTAIPVWARDDEDVPVVWSLTLGLFLIGVFLALLGTYLVALEIRSRLRAERRDELAAQGYDVGDAAKLIDAIGKLRGPIAVLVLAAVALIGTAWISYGSTRPDSPANPDLNEAPATTTIAG